MTDDGEEERGEGRGVNAMRGREKHSGSEQEVRESIQQLANLRGFH
jgi:hypothetical protein